MAQVFVDCFFMFQVIYTFCVGTTLEVSCKLTIPIQSCACTQSLSLNECAEGGQGRYVHDFRRIGKSYLKGMFFFDLVTSFPVAIIEMIVVERCVTSDDGTTSFNPTTLRWMRMLKPLRLTRVLKVVKSRKIVSMMGDMLAIPPRFVRLGKIFCAIFLTIHITACIFWLVKVSTNNNAERQLFLVGPAPSPLALI